MFSMEQTQASDIPSAAPVASHKNRACDDPEHFSEVEAEMEMTEREALIDWCSCGQCSPCPIIEAVCCNDRPDVRDFIPVDGDCITNQAFFQGQLLSEDGLQYNRVLYASTISDFDARRKYLERDFDNRMRRQLCYRNFVIFINKGYPIGRGNRVVIPRCVVTQIRRQYPDAEGHYVGFIESLDRAQT